MSRIDKNNTAIGKCSNGNEVYDQAGVKRCTTQ